MCGVWRYISGNFGPSRPQTPLRSMSSWSGAVLIRSDVHSRRKSASDLGASLKRIKLSVASEASVYFPGADMDHVLLTAADLSLALQGITTRMAVKITEVVMKSVGRIDNIDFVVLSGGSSLNPAVQDAVLAMFRHIPEDRFILPDSSKPEDVERCLCAVTEGLALLRRDGFEPIDFGDF
jgi:hypothetical protein